MAGETNAAEPAGQGSGVLQGVAQVLGTAANFIGKGGPKRQYKYNKKLAAYQNALNRQNAEWLLAQNKELAAFQRDYDSPAQQMARFEAAGLNKNLVYGSGTPGNMGRPLEMGSLPGVNAGQVSIQGYGDIGTEFLQAGQIAAQTSLTGARAEESEARTELLGAQKMIAQSNPMLDPRVYKSVTDSMIAIADAKTQEGKWATTGGSETNGMKKMNADLQNLFNKNFMQGASLDSTQADLKIKNEILQSKEFDNELKKLQVEWMRDGNITPQHMYQGLMLILGKMMK